jgi:hypothetical protein
MFPKQLAILFTFEPLNKVRIDLNSSKTDQLRLPNIPLHLSKLIGLASFAFFVVHQSPVDAEPNECSDPLFLVDATHRDLAVSVCEMALRIRDDLKECGLSQTKLITIEILNRVEHPFGNCLAYFDCPYDLVRITKPGMYGPLTTEDPIYSKFPDEIILRSLLTHELTHALVVHTAYPKTVDIVDQEYIAAAMEIELMEPQWRAVYVDLAELDLERAPSERLIDIWTYSFAPRLFAVNAWRHFKLPENGCNLVRQLVSGELSYSKPIRPELR